MTTMTTLRTPPTPGTMMDLPLTLTWVLEHAVRNYPEQEIVSKLDDGSLHRCTFAEFGERVARLAHALVALGVKPGDRVASFAWNSYRHLELYYAVPCIGAVLHCVNIRLFPEQVAWVLDHADDDVVFADASLATSLARAVALRPERARSFVVMGDGAGLAPARAALPGARDYEALLEKQPPSYAWPEIDERSAAVLCYTSATTGDPKGVAYTHRSQFVHALAQSSADGLNVRRRDTILPIVPMFHVNAWGLPYSALMMGAKLVFAGQRLDPQSVIDLVNGERVTMSAGVPTVWLPVRDELEKRGLSLPTLESVVIGGSACPPSLYDDLTKRGITVVHAWGMTEMSPIGTQARDPGGAFESMPPERKRQELLKQGYFSPIVAWKILDDDGRDVARDGESRGELYVRGFAVTGAYYGLAEPHPSFRDGWFQTGDVCTIDRLGFLQIVDRSKDLVKSGGEWISSVDLENEIMGHPAVLEAAVIGVAHPRWVERPVAVVVLRDAADLDEAVLQAWLAERVAKWWIPDRVVFVEEIPRTGVGKFLKRNLRERFGELLAER